MAANGSGMPPDFSVNATPPSALPVVVSDVQVPGTVTAPPPQSSAPGIPRAPSRAHGFATPDTATPTSSSQPAWHTPPPSTAPPLMTNGHGHPPAQYHQQLQQPQSQPPSQQWAPSPAPPSASQPVTRPPDPHIAKPAIMDPPGRQIPTSQIEASGFPSPNINHAVANPKFVDDISRLTYAIHQSLAESVRRAVRDNWEKCLLGSEFHQAYIMNATIHHASPAVTKRALRDFGAKMVQIAKDEIISHFTPADIDDVAGTILAKASDRFLDQALDQRLRTIEAKPLINALARAERLGYAPDDIVEEDQQLGQERVIPQHHQEAYPGAGGTSRPLLAQVQQVAPGYAQARPGPPLQVAQPVAMNNTMTPVAHGRLPTQPLQCQACFRIFQAPSAFNHHTKKQVCKRTPSSPDGFKFSCQHCGQGFTTVVGLQYHNMNKVCGDFGPLPKAGSSPASPITISSETSTPVPSRTASRQALSSSQPVPVRMHVPPSTPQHPAVLSTSPAGSDPYAHLSSQQRNALNEELKQAEIAYGERMRQAEAIPDPNERRVKLEGLRNSFGTKQSMIRKRYGVKLRERRTKAEIEAERERMGMRDIKRSRGSARSSMGPISSAPEVTATASTAAPRVASGWVAANAPATPIDDAHDGKRRKLSDGEPSHGNGDVAGETDSPSRKRPIVPVSDLGGLTGSASTAATEDPTLPPSAQAPQSTQTYYTEAGAHVEIHEPARDEDGHVRVKTSDSTMASPVASMHQVGSESASASASASVSAPGSAGNSMSPAGGQPMALDTEYGDDAAAGEGDDSGDSDSDSDDNDIPARLPDAVRNSLSSSHPGSLS